MFESKNIGNYLQAMYLLQAMGRQTLRLKAVGT